MCSEAENVFCDEDGISLFFFPVSFFIDLREIRHPRLTHMCLWSSEHTRVTEVSPHYSVIIIVLFLIIVGGRNCFWGKKLALCIFSALMLTWEVSGGGVGVLLSLA